MIKCRQILQRFEIESKVRFAIVRFFAAKVDYLPIIKNRQESYA